MGTDTNATLLYPMKEILSTQRWGWGRDGCNGLSRDIKEVDLSLDTDEIKDIENYSVVFIVSQSI